MSDREAMAALSFLKGIGVWTAEMQLSFSFGRPDIFGFGDFLKSIVAACRYMAASPVSTSGKLPVECCRTLRIRLHREQIGKRQSHENMLPG